MKKRLPFFTSHLSVGITENKLDSLEEITLPRAIAPDDNVVFWGEGLSDGLILVTARTDLSTACSSTIRSSQLTF